MTLSPLFGAAALPATPPAPRKPPKPSARSIPAADVVTHVYPHTTRRRRLGPPRLCAGCGFSFRPETHRTAVGRGTFCTRGCQVRERTTRHIAAVRRALLALLASGGGRSAPELAPDMRLSPDRLLGHLRALEKAGLVIAKPRLGARGGRYKGDGWWLP